MKAITATWKKGRIVPDERVSLPEGCRLIVKPVADEEGFGMREEEWEDTPEAIDEWLRWYDSLEPLKMKQSDWARWEAALQAQQEFDKANSHRWAEELKELFLD
jgi:hypothetical protein